MAFLSRNYRYDRRNFPKFSETVILRETVIMPTFASTRTSSSEENIGTRYDSHELVALISINYAYIHKRVQKFLGPLLGRSRPSGWNGRLYRQAHTGRYWQCRYGVARNAGAFVLESGPEAQPAIPGSRRSAFPRSTRQKLLFVYDFSISQYGILRYWHTQKEHHTP